LVTPRSLHRKCFYFKTDRITDEDYFRVVLKEGGKGKGQDRPRQLQEFPKMGKQTPSPGARSPISPRESFRRREAV